MEEGHGRVVQPGPRRRWWCSGGWGLGRSRLQELLLLRSRTRPTIVGGRGDLGEALVGGERSRGGGLRVGSRRSRWKSRELVGDDLDREEILRWEVECGGGDGLMGQET